MTEPINPVEQVKAQVSDPSQFEGLGAAELKVLIQLMLAERQESLEDRKSKRVAYQAREEQRRINSQFNIADQKTREKLCTHLKGGKSGPKSARIDYAVGLHRFIDGASYIRCLICGAKWKPKDTAEFLVRRGRQVENHTGIGWDGAMKMLAQSTNTPTSSEVVMKASIDVQEPDFNNPNTVEI